MTSSKFPRSLQIMFAFAEYGWCWLRWHRRSPERLPAKLRQMLESLGTTFIKLGQGLSLRRDLLPITYLEALESLQSTVPPFDSALSVSTIESAFGQPVETLFATFERQPFAAASIAQVHSAKMADGRQVVVKVRRPGIVSQINADLRLLRRLLRLTQMAYPTLKVYRPMDLLDELAAFLRLEVDLSHEAGNMRRLTNVFQGLPDVVMPSLIDPLAHPEVLVQSYSKGRPIRRAFGTSRGANLALVLLDAYMSQMFADGVFHADPHPGNLFEMPDGCLCFHDFGSIGYLDPESRCDLVQLIESIVTKDSASGLDAAIRLGFIQGVVERRTYQRAISEILERMSSLPLEDWSVAEAIWQIARIGSGANFRLPRHLLVLLRTLFLAENTLRALDPKFDLVRALSERKSKMAELINANSGRLPLPEQVARSAEQVPALLANALRQLRIDDGRPAVGLHHHGLQGLERTVSRTGNRLALALITLGLYLAGSILMLHGGGPQLWGHVPLTAALAYSLAVLLSVRLIFAIWHSGKL